MAFARNAGFTSLQPTKAADTAAGYLTPDRYNLPLAVSGADVGGIAHFPTATTEATSANLTFTTASGPLLQVGSSNGTSAGFILGYSGSSGYGNMWSTSVTPSATNYALQAGSTQVALNATNNVYLAIGDVPKVTVSNGAGLGPAITAGTATTDVAALSVTRTNNNAAVATGVKFTFTDTTSAAGFLPFQILGGSGAVTNLLSVGKTGILTVGDILVLKGYAIASLPAGIDGAIAMVTDQITAVAAKGVAPTAGGAIHCAVIYNGSAWVGI